MLCSLATRSMPLVILGHQCWTNSSQLVSCIWHAKGTILWSETNYLQLLAIVSILHGANSGEAMLPSFATINSLIHPSIMSWKHSTHGKQIPSYCLLLTNIEGDGGNATLFPICYTRMKASSALRRGSFEVYWPQVVLQKRPHFQWQSSSQSLSNHCLVAPMGSGKRCHLACPLVLTMHCQKCAFVA